MATVHSKGAQLYLLFAVLVLSLCQGLSYAQPKVFFIGLPKTGTKSLTALMQSLGVNACHGGYWTRASRRAETGYFDKNVKTCQAYSDGEQPDYDWLNRAYPGSAFVLNTRPLESWLVSAQSFFKMFVAKHEANIPEKDLVLKHKTKAVDVHRWIVDREAWHKGVLNYFMPNNASTNATASNTTENTPTGVVMATTGVIVRRANPRKPELPPAYFMIVDLTTDHEPKVKEQLIHLMKESGIVKSIEEEIKPIGVVGQVFPPNVEKAKVCVSGVLNEIALTPEERASNLLVGRLVPPLRDDYDGSSCIYRAVTSYSPPKKKKDAQT